MIAAFSKELTVAYLGLLLLMISCLVTSQIFASTMQQSFDSGKTLEVRQTLPSLEDAGGLINENTDLSNYSNLSDQDLTSKSANELNNSELGDFLIKSDEVKIDAIAEHQFNNNNPMLRNSLAIEANPLKETEGDNLVITESVTKIKIAKTCLDGVQFDVDIVRQLVLQTDLSKSWSPWETTSFNEYWAKIDSKYVFRGQLLQNFLQQYPQRFPDGGYLTTSSFLGVNLQEYTGPMRIYQKIAGSYMESRTNCRYQHCDRIELLKTTAKYWQIINEESQSLVEQHECYVINRKCLDSGDKIFHGKYTISRPCWKEQITYHCQSEPINGCKYLTDQNCSLANSICSKKIGNICLQWQRFFQCFSEKKELRSSISNNSFFCLGGDCHTPNIEGNDDIHNVGYLAMLSEMRKDMQGSPINIFKGALQTCDKCLVNFIDCCSSMKGWGKDLALSSCSSGEKALALKKTKGLCHLVGTYCYRKDPVFKQCLKKKTSFCCFESKLARIFQQQGKEQLAIGFGSPEVPNCRGFTVEELQRIDFSKFDLEELFADLISSAKSKIAKKFPSTITNQMPLKQNNRSGNDY